MHRMKWFVVPAFLVLPAAFIAANGGDGESCPVREKVAGLLSSWKAAAEEAKALGIEAREEIKSRLAGLAKECPLGSRMGGTFTAVRGVLGNVIAAEEANAKHCPFAAAEKSGAKSEACPEGRKLKEARSKILRDLHKLASYPAGDEAPAACCAEGAQAPAAEKSGAACCSGCAEKLPARVAALKASWEKAGPEFEKVPAAKRQEIFAGVGEIARKSKAVALTVPTALALADGFDGLEAIHGKMEEWVQANPQAVASVPEEARKCFESQRALIHDTRAALHRMRDALEASGVCDKPCAGGEEAKTTAKN